MWAIDASCVSSKSRPWQSIPFARAAAAAGTAALVPNSVAGPDCPSASATCCAAVPAPTACAARPQPSVSSRCWRTTSIVCSGTSDKDSPIAHSASVSLAVRAVIRA